MVSEKKVENLKRAIKDGVSVNKKGEVELNKNLQNEIAGGVTPEQQENEGCELNIAPVCGLDVGCSER